MNRNVVILGAGGHAHVIADIITACGDTVVAFLDDDSAMEGTSGPISKFTEYKDCEFVIGIGNTDARRQLSELDVKWYTAIHPSAVISPVVVIEEGTVVMANAVVNSNAVIGRHCIINSGAIVEHNDTIGDFTHISVGAKLGGTVHIGEATWIGIGATVSNNINICAGCMVGAGAVVVKDVTCPGKYAGVPAREM